MKTSWIVILAAFSSGTPASAQKYRDTDGKIKVALVKMPFSGERNVTEYSGGPDYLEQGGLLPLLEGLGVRLKPTPTVKLGADEEDYGTWHRLGSRTDTSVISWPNEREVSQYRTQANCSSSWGARRTQRSGPRGGLSSGVGVRRRPATTPRNAESGMLSGIPVAISAECLGTCA
jgi:hypothetical protein